MKWESKQCQFPDVPTSVNDKTVVFVYGWFGLWHDDLCSKDDAKVVCEKLNKLLENDKLKVIIAMRSDTYSKYKTELKNYDPLFRNQVDLSNEKLLDDYLKCFTRLKDSCINTQCQCHNLTEEMLRKGKDESIGMPLKVEIILKYHEHFLLQSYCDDSDILTAMTAHFKALKENERPIYEWIMYICLKGHFSRSESFDKDLVNKVQFQIKMSSFNEHYGQLRKYIRVWFGDPQNVSAYDAQYVFWHPFIYISAFHYLYKKDETTVMNYCNVNAILQLVRPSSYTNKGIPSSTSYIEVSAGKANVDSLRKRLRKLGILNKYKDHPLLKDTDKNDQ